MLRLLAVSRSGLTATELLEILELIGYRENVKVTQFDWLVLRRCLGDHVTESSTGMLNFSHQQLREVVEYVLLRKYHFNPLLHRLFSDHGIIFYV